MPVSKVVCPHCEKSVEVNMTSVTRSRKCPSCGKQIMLQVIEKSKKTRRKALLMPGADVLDKIEKKPETVHLSPKREALPGKETSRVPPPPPQREGPAPAAAPVPTEAEAQEVLERERRLFEGDPRRRMIHDPEVQAKVKALKVGAISTAVLLIIMILGNALHWWSYIGAAMGRLADRITGTKPQIQIIDEPDSPDEAARKKLAEGPEPARLEFGKPPSATGQSEDPEELARRGAEQLVRGFLDAPNVDERLNFVRQRSVMEPKLREYYGKKGDGPVDYDRDSLKLQAEGAYGVGTYNFSVTLSDGAKRLVVVGRTKGGGYAVDWPSFVIYNEMEWAEFQKVKPGQSRTFRVLAAKGDHFGGVFADSKWVMSVKLTNPQDPGAPPLYGYAQRSTSLGRALQFVVDHASGKSVPLMVRLKYPDEGGSPDQVWIDELIGEGWVSRNW